MMMEALPVIHAKHQLRLVQAVQQGSMLAENPDDLNLQHANRLLLDAAFPTATTRPRTPLTLDLDTVMADGAWSKHGSLWLHGNGY